MRKVLFQGIITVLVFLVTWFAIDRVDWMHVLNISQAKESLEKKLGDIFVEIFRSDKEVNDDLIFNPVDSLLTTICRKNGIPGKDVRLHIIENSDINAFALPDDHLIINTGLLKAAENQEELCGVICHELAHIESGHVMKKLVREAGLRMLITMTGTGGGPEAVRKTAGILSSTAYDRKLESEADKKATEYLTNAGINAEPFASFLYRISDPSNNLPAMSWVSTHPDAEERAAQILELCKGRKTENNKIIREATWVKMKNLLDASY